MSKFEDKKEIDSEVKCINIRCKGGKLVIDGDKLIAKIEEESWLDLRSRRDRLKVELEILQLEKHIKLIKYGRLGKEDKDGN